MTLDPQWCHCRADRTVVRTVRAADIATLRLWADAQPAHASVSIFALQRALATVVDLRRQLQDAKAQEDAAWGLLVADLAPDGAP